MFPENGVAVPWEITKYNDNTCKLEGKLKPNIPISSMKKFVAISEDDYAKVEKYFKTECENKKAQHVTPTQNTDSAPVQATTETIPASR